MQGLEEKNKNNRNTQNLQQQNKQNYEDQYQNQFQQYAPTNYNSINKQHNMKEETKNKKSYDIKKTKSNSISINSPQLKLFKNSYKMNRMQSCSDYQNKNLGLFELKLLYKQRTNLVLQIKQGILQKKNKIKDIENHIDKKVMNNKILKGRKNINIRQIFSNKNTHSNIQNEKILQLTCQLSDLRKTIKYQKDKLNKCQQELNGPINKRNYEEALIFQNIIAAKDSQIQFKNNQKNTLNNQIQKMYRFLPLSYIQTLHEQQSKLKQTLNQLNRQINIKRASIYQIEKEDVIIAQKTQFFNQMLKMMDQKKKQNDNNLQGRNNKQIKEQIKSVSQQIFKFYQQRLQIQEKRGTILQNTELQYQKQLKFKEEIQKQIRVIEAYFMQRNLLKRAYDRKIQFLRLQKIQEQKQKQKMMGSKQKNDNMAKSIPKKRATPIIYENQFQTSLKQEQEEAQKKKQMKNFSKQNKKMLKNDKEQELEENKNFITQIKYQQNRQKLIKNKLQEKQINLGCFNAQDSELLLMKDELQCKSLLSSINFVMDNDFLYGLFCTYEDENSFESIKGCNMISKVLPKNVIKKKIEINIQNGEYLNYIKIGFNENKMISYFLINTSSNSIQWGAQDKCEIFQQKQIPKYSNISVKASLNHTIPQTTANSLCIVGIGFKIQNQIKKI